MENKHTRTIIAMELYEFLTTRDMSIYHISDIDIHETKDVITINIHTHQPGILIGRAGRTLKEWTIHIDAFFDKIVTTELTENKLWSGAGWDR